MAGHARSKPDIGGTRALVEPDADALAHAPAFIHGSWACRVCGKTSRTHAAASAGVCTGRLQAAQEAHASHSLHAAFFGEVGGRLPLVLCSRCGAHGTSKATNLAKPCPAVGCGSGQTGRKRQPYYKQARAVQQGRHPSRPGVMLQGLAPLGIARRQPAPPAPPVPPPPPPGAAVGPAVGDAGPQLAAAAGGPGEPSVENVLQGIIEPLATDEFDESELFEQGRVEDM